MLFRIERQSGTAALGPGEPPWEGAEQGVLPPDPETGEPSQPGWFIEFDEIPPSLGDFRVRFTKTDEAGVEGLLTIEDQTPSE